MGARGWIAIDAGQTGLRLRVADHTVEVRSSGVGVSPLVRGITAAWAEWTALRPRPDGLVGAAVGLTGDLSASDGAELRATLFSVLGVEELRLAHDSVPAYLGALGARPGVVTMCGTGAVTLAWSGEGAPRRFDGLGPVLGDRGGGASLARAGLRAAARALEGTGPDTALTVPVVDRWGAAVRLATAIREQGPEALEFVRDFTRAVADAARAGDEVATSIVVAGARDAAATTRAAAEATGASTVSYAGAVFREIELFRRSWIRTVEEGEPSRTVATPGGDALDGALVIAAVDPRHLAAWDVVIERRDTREHR